MVANTTGKNIASMEWAFANVLERNEIAASISEVALVVFHHRGDSPPLAICLETGWDDRCCPAIVASWRES